MKLLKPIYYIFLTCIAVIALLLVASIFPITGNWKIMVVQSGSMQPAVKMGNVVVTKPVSEYKVGDIITFKDPDSPKNTITHRLHEIKEVNGEIRYITKGDANNAADKEGITKKYIVGKVVLNVPYVGYAVETAKKPYGFIALIAIPALIIIFDEGKKIIKEIKRIRNHESRITNSES